MTGSSVAVAATVSMIAFPEMVARGYSRKLTLGCFVQGDARHPLPSELGSHSIRVDD